MALMNKIVADPSPTTPSYYAPCYCEENVYLLCQELSLRGEEDESFFVVFISNPSQSVALWSQRSATQVGYPVIWVSFI